LLKSLSALRELRPRAAYQSIARNMAIQYREREMDHGKNQLVDETAETLTFRVGMPGISNLGDHQELL
jgi:hypothetical protein